MGDRLCLAGWCLLVLGVGLLAGNAFGATAPAVGDCEQAKNSSTLKCSGVQDCGMSPCYAFDFRCANGTCAPAPCKAMLDSDIRKFGKCDTGTGPCFFCKTYYCCTGSVYQSKDGLGQCQTLRCTLVVSRPDACIP
jgi:hypothetical protein